MPRRFTICTASAAKQRAAKAKPLRPRETRPLATLRQIRVTHFSVFMSLSSSVITLS
jgi:hypothetical protein